MVDGLYLYGKVMNKNKKTQEKNIDKLMSLLSRTKDKSLVFEALIDEGQLEDKFETLAEDLSLLASILSAYELRAGGQLSGTSLRKMIGEEFQDYKIRSIEYCLDKLLKKFERFDESVSQLLDAKEQLKLTVLEKEKSTSNSSEEEVSTPFH